MTSKTEALLLLASGCAHCPSVLSALCELVKQGELARLEVVNIAERPDIAEQLGVRSVPWTRIGPFELEGLHSPKELAEWTAHANRCTGMAEYLSGLLESGKLARVVALTEAQPQHLSALLTLLASLDTPMAVRIGIGAVIEDFSGSQALQQQIPALVELSRSPEAQIRADACHYLGLTGSAEARAPIRQRLEDEDAEVREIAEESLAMIAAD